jgi:TRAP-type C4-dicarboxylate transport system substrate-binding protein
MNLKTWNSLPADIQKIIEEMSGPALNEKYAASWDNEAQVSRDTLKKGGVENIQLSPEEMKAWNQRLKPVTEAWVAEMESKGLPGKKIFEEALALVHKYSK